MGCAAGSWAPHVPDVGMPGVYRHRSALYTSMAARSKSQSGKVLGLEVMWEAKLAEAFFNREPQGVTGNAASSPSRTDS